MKRIFQLAVLLAMCIAAHVEIKAQSNQLSDEMSLFLQSCQLLNQGIVAKDEALVADAAEGFGDLNIVELEEYNVDITPTSSLTFPTQQYNSEFCDELRKSQFVIIERAPLAVNRTLMDDATINTISRNLSPASEVKLTMKGAGEMELSLTAADPDALQLMVTTGGKEIEVSKDSSTGFYFAKWDIDTDEEDFSVTISNPGDTPVAFAVAVK